MSFWVRERKMPNGKWIPDVDEEMCLEGTRFDAAALLEDLEDDHSYRIRRYGRIEARERTKP